MYYYLLIAHSWNRWLVFITGLISIILASRGYFGNKEFKKIDNAIGTSFIGSLHLQFLLGLFLYFFYSPYTQTAFKDWGVAMKIKELRYWGIEHIFGMVIGVAIAQTGRIRSKKALKNLCQHQQALIFYTISLLIILGTVYFANRPWIRL